MSTFSQLRADAMDLVGRSDIGGATVLLVRLAQDLLERRYLPRFLRKVGLLTPQGDYYLLPAEVRRVVALRQWTPQGMSVTLEEVPEKIGRQYALAGVNTLASTNYFWRETGGIIRVAAGIPSGATLELDYYEKTPYLVADADTNAWSLNAYDIFLYSLCAQIAEYLVDPDRASMYSEQISTRLQWLWREDTANEMAGRDVVLKGGFDA